MATESGSIDHPHTPHRGGPSQENPHVIPSDKANGSLPSDDCLLAGNLSKKGEVMGLWTSRYYILTQSELGCYKKVR